jgi:hypothetical protein
MDPPPTFAQKNVRDAFWEEMLTEPLEAVIRMLSRRFTSLREASLGVDPRVLAFGHQRLANHAHVVDYLMDESARVDWDTLCDIAPAPCVWSKHALAEYLRGPAPQLWKIRVMHWFSRAR